LNIKTTDEELMAMEISFANLTSKFTDDGFNPYACAAVMTKLALMIYKTSMDNEEYNLMVDSISNSRDQIKSFTEVAKIGRLN